MDEKQTQQKINNLERDNKRLIAAVELLQRRLNHLERKLMRALEVTQNTTERVSRIDSLLRK